MCGPTSNNRDNENVGQSSAENLIFAFVGPFFYVCYFRLTTRFPLCGRINHHRWAQSADCICVCCHRAGARTGISCWWRFAIVADDSVKFINNEHIDSISLGTWAPSVHTRNQFKFVRKPTYSCVAHHKIDNGFYRNICARSMCGITCFVVHHSRPCDTQLQSHSLNGTHTAMACSHDCDSENQNARLQCCHWQDAILYGHTSYSACTLHNDSQFALAFSMSAFFIALFIYPPILFYFISLGMRWLSLSLPV